jgi:putative membrane protein
MKALLIRWGVIALAVWVTSLLLPGMTIHGGIQGVLMVSLVFGLINAIIKPIVKLLTCPLVILTLGLFVLVINTLMLMLTAFFMSDYLTLSGSFNGFFTAFFASIIISIVTSVMNLIVPDEG